MSCKVDDYILCYITMYSLDNYWDHKHECGKAVMSILKTDTPVLYINLED